MTVIADVADPGPPHPPGQTRKFTVVLGSDSLAGRRSGIGRVTLEIARELRRTPDIASLRLWVGDRFQTVEFLDRIDDDSELPLSASSPTLEPRPLRIMLGRIPGMQALRMKKHTLAVRNDMNALRASAGRRFIYHEPNMIAKPFAGTTVVQVNDLSWHHHPEMHPRERIIWIERNIEYTLRQSSRFVVLSEFTANGLATEFGISRDLIDVVHCAASDEFRMVSEAEAAPTLRQYGLEDRGYILSVSTLEPRKNFDRVVEAHAALPKLLRDRYPLVIAGGTGWGTTLASPRAERARREGSLVLLGHVPDAHLVALTSRTALFVYASLYEGFGLPVLEAMGAGAPVLASSTTATGETAGDAARLIDPLDPGDIANGMREMLEDPALCEAFRNRGLQHAARYTWRATVAGLLASWERAVS